MYSCVFELAFSSMTLMSDTASTSSQTLLTQIVLSARTMAPEKKANPMATIRNKSGNMTMHHVYSRLSTQRPAEPVRIGEFGGRCRRRMEFDLLCSKDSA